MLQTAASTFDIKLDVTSLAVFVMNLLMLEPNFCVNFQVFNLCFSAKQTLRTILKDFQFSFYFSAFCLYFCSRVYLRVCSFQGIIIVFFLCDCISY
jgi:hypothetical protein